MLFRIPFFIRSLVATAIAFAMVAGSGVSSAQSTSDALANTRNQIAEIRKRIAAAKGKATGIQTQVSALDAQIAALTHQMRAGEHDISGLESEIRTTEANIAELGNRYAIASQASNERARRLYKSGPAETLSRLLSSKSVIEFVRLQVLWNVSSEQDGKAMLTATRLRGALIDKHQDLDSIRTDLTAQKRWLEQRRSLIAVARNEKNKALQSVQAEINAEEQNIKKLEEQSKRLTASLQSNSSLSRSSGAVSKSGFIWPLHGAITSPYGPRRGGFHPGIDIDGNTGDPIRASKAGTLVGVSCGSGYGICTIIDHGGGVSTLYAHQSRKAVSGGTVAQGQVIGYVGCTGYCSGSHLHFEVRVNGEPRNPREFLP